MYLLLFFLITCISCNNDKNSSSGHSVQQGEFIHRLHHEFLFHTPVTTLQTREPYPWEQKSYGTSLLITKEFFRCKGNQLNLAKVGEENGEAVRYSDCGGAQKHSLPLRDGKEFIYPILIDLLNYIQSKTQKKVIITSGHRCPEHNTYVDPLPTNRYSKHMVGAEVSFYVQGLENQPEKVIKFLQEYYTSSPKHQNKKEFTEFKRYEKDDVNVTTLPWYNKEIFIKLFKASEGRNFDNRHHFPYISIQVRYDVDKGEKVIYTWPQANNYLRH